jgi:hypothetical protein
MNLKTVAILAALWAAPALRAQQFTLWDRNVDIHGFFSQGFAYSNDNNYLTMDTSSGSFAMTDAGGNISMRVTEKFRVGAQVYMRNIGQLGAWRPTLDWALGDYKFADWFGFRAGKVKTVMGLYNDTQDMEFLHTWAILPQSRYPLDLRSSTIAHTGGDIYGEIGLKHKIGSVAYTAYAGTTPDDLHGGMRLAFQSEGLTLTAPVQGYMYGADLRWNNPLPGVMLGVSELNAYSGSKGVIQGWGIPWAFDTKTGKAQVYYVDYIRGNLHMNGEYSREWSVRSLTGIPGVSSLSPDTRDWYASIAYRLGKHLEIGTYHSRFINDARSDWDSPNNHIYDQAVTARVDINRHWNFKVEGHFMDGTGNPYSVHGFYATQNPNGLVPKTDLLVLRTGVNF